MTRHELKRLIGFGHGRAAKYILENGPDRFERLIWRAMTEERPYYLNTHGKEYFATLILALSNPDQIVARTLRLIRRASSWQRYLLKSIVIELAHRGRKDCRNYVFKNWRHGLVDGNLQLAMGYASLRKSASIPLIVAEAQRMARSSTATSRLSAMQSLIPYALSWEKAVQVERKAIDDCPELVTVGKWQLHDEDNAATIHETYSDFDSLMEGIQKEFFSNLPAKFELRLEDLDRLRLAVIQADADATRERLLVPFKQQIWPGDTTPLFGWVKGGNHSLRSRSIDALAIAQPDALRQYALDLIHQQPVPRKSIAEVLNRVAKPEDEPMLLELLKSADSQEQRYEITREITNLLGSAKSGFTALRREIYESSECEFHRRCAVRGLLRTRCMSMDLIEECVFDSDYYTRKLAQKALRNRTHRRTKNKP